MDALLVTFATMKKITTYIISFIAIVLILASSTGLSFVVHHCNSSQSNSFKFFTDHYKCKTEIENEQSKPNCCCAKHSEMAENKLHNNLNKSDCCKNTYKYLKVSFQYDNGISVQKTIIAHIPFVTNTCSFLNSKQIVTYIYSLYHPPPLAFYGKHLIYFIQNIKIPFHSSC